MPNLNKVLLMGNLTRDPETKYTAKGIAIVDFGIAINEKWKDANGEPKEETLFADITYFGKVAEVIGKHFKKGQPIYIEGKLKLDSWEDKTSGQQRSKMKIVGETFQFLGSSDKSGNQSRSEPSRREESQPAQRAESQRELPSGGADDSDIPFTSFEKYSPLPI